MGKAAEQSANRAVDSIQHRLTSYACDLSYDGLPPQAVLAAKVRIIDTPGALIGGYFGEPCRIARNLAAQMPDAGGATVIGTRGKTTPDMAAFTNATTARYVELTDSYHWPGSHHGHASDMITPVLGAAEHRWNPDRESADGSIPYVTAVALMDGTVTPRSYNDARLWNPELRALMQKVEVVENPEFTAAFERLPIEHRTRVTVVMHSGERLVGEAGGDQDDLSAPKSDAQIEEKFRGLTGDVLGAKQVNAILERLWSLEEIANVAEIPQAFVLA